MVSHDWKWRHWKHVFSSILCRLCVQNKLYRKQTFKLILLKAMFEILTVSESNLDDSFPESQLLVEGFGTSICLGRNRNGRIMFFIPKVSTTKVCSQDRESFESFHEELIFENHISLSPKYKNVIILGDFDLCSYRGFLNDSFLWNLQIA